MNKFATPQGKRYLEGLFFEKRRSADQDTAVYTLKDRDHNGYPSLYRLYMEANDPTEWRFAHEHLDGYEHWTMLCECEWFQPFLTRWRKELELKIRGAALLAIREEAANPESKSAFLANKLLLAGGWKDKEEADASKRGRGRPSKKDIMDEAKAQAEALQTLNDDLKRLESLN
ncbi:MAG: hypothetical protein KDA17_05690 [Candidatus Saccharibacteria bacterium]|nr:hypothetical protein [Candidatus Saccharibacteria bacterium]